MIAALLAVALLQQGGGAPASLTVRIGERSSGVPVVVTQLGAMVRLDDVLAPLGAVLMRDDEERFRLFVSGTEFTLQTGRALVGVRGKNESLPAPPTRSGGQLYIPLALFTEVVPRAIPDLMYEPSRGELRRNAPAPPKRVAEAPRDTAPSSSTGGRAGSGASPAPSVRAPRRERAPVVVVDAGHGGRDRGMRGPLGGGTRIYEADVTLDVAERLRDELRSRGVDVVMTRSTDTLIALRDRGRIANRAQGDLFVSIHVNAANPRWKNPAGARGFETYFLSEARTDDDKRVADLENEAVKYEVEADAPANDPLSFILNDMKQNEYLRESSNFATTVQRALKAVHPGTDRGVKQAGFVVLIGAFMPSVLVEIGFGTNASEAAYISSAAGQGELARALAGAIMTYLERYGERRTTGTAQ